MTDQPRALCPCCGQREAQRLGKLQDSGWFAGKRLEAPLAGGELFRCTRCQLKFRHPIPDRATYERLYDNAAVSTWPADEQRPDWDLVIDHIGELLPRGGRVLDFGCYSGGLLARLATVYERFGVEVNRAAAAAATEHTRAQVWQRVDDIPRDLRFDAVIAADVIEHLANPVETVGTLMTLLSSQGVLIITTGDADNSLWNRFGANWWYCLYPEHVAFVSKGWFEYFSDERRWSVTRCATFRRTAVVRHPRIATALTYCYGWFPSAYLSTVGALRKMLGRTGASNVPGNGISADHILVVLTRRGEP